MGKTVNGGGAFAIEVLFIVAPLVGALLAGVVWPLVRADDDVNPPRAESVEATAEASESVAAITRQA